jgi:aspartyl-tRNA synthetase
MTYRDRNIGELAQDGEGTTVHLCGWVAAMRNHGGMVFFNLRDRWGEVQVVAQPDRSEVFEMASSLHPEYVVSLRGVVRNRPQGLDNPDMALGSVEVVALELGVLNPSASLPFVLVEGEDVAPLTRMKYRYLDMRRPALRDALFFRHRTSHEVRSFLTDRGFVDIETPVLTRSTPEGARDYLVPSRVHPGSCYALPQSPQLFKQLLMVAGFDRYFQIVRCFRDEDQRADRQPEFTQIDIEMSFVEADDVMGLAEELVITLFDKLLGVKIPSPIRRIPYAEAMARYGSDKPDLRFDLAFEDVTELVADCGFRVFSSQAPSGGVVLGLRAPGAGGYSRRQISVLEETARSAGLKGLVTFKVEAQGLSSSAAKFFDAETLAGLAGVFGAEPGDLLVFAAGPREETCAGLGEVRRGLGRDLGLADPARFALCWLVDPPLFTRTEGRLDPVHHPFTKPRSADLPLLDSAPDEVLAEAYDLVLNGHEVAGGSIRIHLSDLQAQIFSLIGLDEAEASEKFGFLLEAFRFGAPPHGGIAFGFDRLVALMQGTENIRDVIAFPKTTRAFCPLTGAPGPVTDRQLADLNLLPKEAPTGAQEAQGEA